MSKTLCILAIILFGPVAIFAQKVSKDDHHDLVERAQGLNTTMFLSSLEQGRIDEAIALIAPAFLNRKAKYRDSLTAYHKELSQLTNNTKLSIVVVTPDKNYNTYRAIYHNRQGDHFYLDLYYHKGETNSKIARIKKLPVKESASEKKEVAEAKTTKRSGSAKAAKKTATKGKKKSRLA
jgi:hypothetical protein